MKHIKIYMALAIIITSIFGCTTQEQIQCEELFQTKVELEKNVEMYATVWERVVDERNISLIDTLFFDPNATVITSNGNVEGIDAFKDFYSNYVTGFSDAEFKVIDAFGQGDRIVKHWQFKGTHDGEFFGIPATNKKVDLKGTTLVTMKNGRVMYEEDYFDNYSLLKQIGLLK
jgi:steroid delta-isomerase-like uncharacterized protein